MNSSLVFPDTSIWIEYFRGKNTKIVQTLNTLLDEDQIAILAPVWLEILTGAAKNEIPQLKRVFSALPHYFPEKSHWDIAEGWAEKARQTGFTLSAIDLIIGAIVSDNQGSLWSLDQDFKQFEKLKFIKLFSAKD